MEITNEYLIELAEREMRAIKDISHPLASFTRMFNKEKQQEAVEKVRCHKERMELIFEIQKHLNKQW